MKSNILLISEFDNKEREEKDFINEIINTNKIKVHNILFDGEYNSTNFVNFDIVVFFIKFKTLLSLAPIDWGNYRGPRILYDHDTIQNFGTFFNNKMSGMWNSEFHRHKFDSIIVTSQTAALKFNENKIKAYWLPKSYDSKFFYDKHIERSGICTFGSLYRSRAKLMRELKNHRIAINFFKTSYSQLNAELNKYQACLICNMPASIPFGKFGRAIERLSPGILTKPVPGYEVFFKNLESAASGCIQICDSNPDLEALGFYDGHNCITYNDFNELFHKLEKFNSYDLSKMRLESINTALRHTNKVRATEFVELCHTIHNTN